MISLKEYIQIYSIISKSRVLNTDIHGLVLHMGVENSSLVVALLLAYTVQWLRGFVWSRLAADRTSCVVSLIQLPTILMRWISWPLGNWPMRLFLVDTGVWAFLRMVGAWANNLWSGIQLYKRVKSFDSPSGIQTVLWLIGNLWLKVGNIFRPRSHFVFLLVRRKLNKSAFTLESPPNLVFPTCCLLERSASFISSWIGRGVHRYLFWSSAST